MDTDGNNKKKSSKIAAKSQSPTGSQGKLEIYNIEPEVADFRCGHTKEGIQTTPNSSPNKKAGASLKSADLVKA